MKPTPSVSRARRSAPEPARHLARARRRREEPLAALRDHVGVAAARRLGVPVPVGGAWPARVRLMGGAAGLSRPGRARSPVGANVTRENPEGGLRQAAGSGGGPGSLDGRGLAAAPRRGTGYGGERERAGPAAGPGPLAAGRAGGRRRLGGAGTQAWPEALGLGLPLWPATTAGSAGAPHPGTRPRRRPPAGDLRYRPFRFSRVTSAPTGDRARPGRERPAAPPIRGVCAGQDEPGSAGRASRSRTRPPSDDADKITTSRA
jgi:hypothetical protein